jgi:hypothetical protein
MGREARDGTRCRQLVLHVFVNLRLPLGLRRLVLLLLLLLLLLLR